MPQIKKIERLTPAQEVLLADTYQEWLRVGRSTARINRPEAQTVIGDMYEAIGEKRPVVLFFSSPIMCMFAYAFLKDNLLKDRSQLFSQLSSQLRSQLDSQLSSQLSSQLFSQLSSQLFSQLFSQLNSQLDSQLFSQLSSQLDSQLSSQLS